MADDDPSEIHLHWEPPSENLIHRGGVDIKWNGPRPKGLANFPRYNEVVFRIFYCYWGKENRSLYQGLRYIEVLYIEIPLYSALRPKSDN